MYIKQLGILVLTILVSFSLFAEEKKKNQFKLLAKDVYFQPGGGIRMRYENLRNATGGGFPDDEDESQASHRAQFDLRLYKGEYMETFFRLINVADWGGANGDTSGGQHDSFSRSNGLLVNQAWGLWKVDESIGLRFGRAPLHLGLGYTYGGNDWFNVPYSFDLIDVSWDWESVKLSLIAAKVQEFTKVAGQTLSSDPEENHIIVSLDVKNIADAVRVFNFNLVQVNRDLGSPDGGATVLNGLNMQRLSLESELKGKNFFGSVFLSYVTGEEKVAPINSVNNIEKLSLTQTAVDVKAGYGFSEYSNLRFWGGYHFDSGDKVSGDSESQSYDSFFYEVYGQSGLMDLIRWGNLTFYRIGLELDIYSGLTLGAEWLSMDRTESSDGIQFGDAGRFYQDRIGMGDFTLGNEKNIGNEFDIWLDRKFHSGVNVRVSFANFFPGKVFEGATTTTGNTPDSSFFQFLAQVGYFF